MSQEFAGKSISWPDISVQMLPKMSVDLSLISLMTVLAPLLLMTAYIYFLQYLTVILVSEKETFIKQHMLMMGMRDAAYWYTYSPVLFRLIARLL